MIHSIVIDTRNESLAEMPEQYADAETGFQYLRARYYDPATGQFLSRDPLTSVTLSPYGYVDDNPLNATDPTGLICFSWNCVKNDVKAVAGAPGAVVHSVILNAESVISVPIYAAYYIPYRINKAFPGNPLHGLLLDAQHVGLWADVQWDGFQQCSGYPGASPNDEAQPVNFFPSIIYPSLNGSGDWMQKKFTYGPKTSGPGRGPDGHEDFAP